MKFDFNTLIAKSENPKKDQLHKESQLLYLDIFLVLLPAIALMLVGKYEHLILLAFLGMAIDFCTALSKFFWVLLSLVTIPFVVGVYYAIGRVVVENLDISVPYTDTFSIYTVGVALIFSRLFLSLMSFGGIASERVDLQIEVNDWRRDYLNNTNDE